ncbi:MAG: PEP-CTERM sorting domain-containing protein, partial [Thermoguttaceae bacterium]
ADGNAGNGFTPFTNDMPFGQIPVAPNTPIAVWQGEPIPVEIVALTLASVEPIAVNEFIPFGIFGDDGVNLLDSSFGIFTGDWDLPLTENVLIDEDGIVGGPLVMSPFLKDWKPKFQIRWKSHRTGLVPIVVGPQIPGPAGILHPVGGGVPEPSTMILALLGLVGLFVQGRRRRRG